MVFGFPWVFSSRWTCAVESQKGRQCTSLSHRSRGERRASVGRREPRLTDDVSGTRLAARLQALNCVTSPAGAGGHGPRNRLAAVHKAPRRSGPSSRRSPPVTPLFLSRVPAAACPLLFLRPCRTRSCFRGQPAIRGPRECHPLREVVPDRLIQNSSPFPP